MPMPRAKSPILQTTPSLLPSALPKEDFKESSATQILPSASNSLAVPSPQPFSPFFTLITDAHSTSTHHPAVHYLFSDDDSDLITDAALHIHDSQDPNTKQPTVNPRYVVVTLDETGTGLESAHSMTGDWQILNAEVGKAPTLEGEGEKEGLMLKIEGTQGVKGLREEVQERMGLEALVEAFGRRMGELRKVVEGGAIA